MCYPQLYQPQVKVKIHTVQADAKKSEVLIQTFFVTFDSAVATTNNGHRFARQAKPISGKSGGL